MTVDSDIEFDEDEIDDKKHNKLVEDVLNLSKRQGIKKPSRTEPTSDISEFSLVRPSTAKKGSVHLKELTKVIGKRENQLKISQIVRASNKNKTLPAPLLKPQAEQIRRTLNYEKSRLQLDKWEALVTSNRVKNLSFPLEKVEKLKIEEKKAEKFPSMWRMKSDLQKELEKLEPIVVKPTLNEEAEHFELTLKELQEKRKEAAKLRAYQSYKEAKLRRQGKIKSKKYHRILKREKIKQKLKEFEDLQKTNPEEAMKKLEDIEKARAEERFNLRHKGTGQWAKNKQVRAKYDKESRQELAQQLAISRELTQKLKSADDSDYEDMETELVENKSDKNNPWVNGIKPDKEVNDFVSGFRKYWQDHNKDIAENEKDLPEVDQLKEVEKDKKVMKQDKLAKKKIDKSKKNKQSKIKKVKENKHKTIEKNKGKIVQKNENKVEQLNSEWEVSSLNEKTVVGDVEDIFNVLEDKINKKIKKKIRKVADITKTINKKKTNTRKTSKAIKKKIDLTMKPNKTKQIIDEELLENTKQVEENPNEQSVENSKTILKNMNVSEITQEHVNINPEKFMKVKKTTLKSAIPDLAIPDDNEENGADQKQLILEAFEDDDIAEDFKTEKAKVVDEETPKDIDLTLPGWGSWAGSGIKPSKRKNRRLILKMPAPPPRKDENRGSLIINEKAQSKIKPLLVSEVPFPFKTVKDYEAAVRAPIGNTFVPERAFKKLIEPSVTTKMGAIIEPITRSALIGKRNV